MYLRAREAALEALNVISEGYSRNKRELSATEARIFQKIKNFLENAPGKSESFIEKNLSSYAGKVKNFSPKNYGL